MFGILVATHGKMAEGIVDAGNLIVGEQDNIDHIALVHGKDIEEFGNELADKIRALDTGEGVLVLTDIYGASPYNQSAMKKQELSDVNYRIFSGVNLPMYLEAISKSLINEKLENVWEELLETSKESIRDFDVEFSNV